MAGLSRRAQQRTDIWPGFVDALATLLMVIIFLLMIFVLAQFFLGEALSGRDQALTQLKTQVSELADLLALERRAGEDLRQNVSQLSDQLQSTVAARDDLTSQLQSMTIRAESAEEQAQQIKQELSTATARIAALASDNQKARSDLEDAFKTIQADKEKIEVQLRKLAGLSRDVEALRALREELQNQIKVLAGNLQDKDKELDKSKSALLEERQLSTSARAEVALLNQQMRALRRQIAQLNQTLEASEQLTDEQKAQIVNLGKRLNAALATKVQELSRYRSEFFGRLREILGNQRGIQIVGDRFVFQSEVLFQTGSSEIGDAGKTQMQRLATSLREIAGKIPANIDWILRVDGHTDQVPIKTTRFPSNWELSTARAVSVVKFLIEQGIPANRLAATGFGEFQPIDQRTDEIAYRRNRRIELKLTQR